MLVHLTDEHASGHSETGAWREMRCDHDTQSSLWERELVWPRDEQLVHHHYWRLLPWTCWSWEQEQEPLLLQDPDFTLDMHAMRTDAFHAKQTQFKTYMHAMRTGAFHAKQTQFKTYMHAMRTGAFHTKQTQFKTSQVTYVTMVPRVGNETLRPLGVATGNALSVTRSEDTYVKTPPVGRRQPMTSRPACHNISAAGRIHHQLLRLKLASEAWPEA